MEQRKGEKFNHYPCDKCHGHHIGHPREFLSLMMTKNEEGLLAIEKAKKEGRLR